MHRIATNRSRILVKFACHKNVANVRDFWCYLCRKFSGFCFHPMAIKLISLIYSTWMDYLSRNLFSNLNPKSSSNDISTSDHKIFLVLFGTSFRSWFGFPVINLNETSEFREDDGIVKLEKNVNYG